MGLRFRIGQQNLRPMVEYDSNEKSAGYISPLTRPDRSDTRTKGKQCIPRGARVHTKTIVNVHCVHPQSE